MEIRVVAVALLYDVIVFILCFLIFLYFRRIRCDSLSKGAARKNAPAVSPLSLSARAVALRNTRERGVTDALWETFKILLHTSDSEYKSLDVQYYLSFLKSLQLLFAMTSFFSITAALPVNLSVRMKTETGWTWIGRSSVEYVTAKDWRMFFLMALVVVYSLIAYYVVYRFWRSTKLYETLVTEHGELEPESEGTEEADSDSLCDSLDGLESTAIDSRAFHPEFFTIKIEGIQRHLTGAPTIVAQHFMALFPEEFLCSRLVMDFREHLRVLQKLRKTAAKLRALSGHQECSGGPARCSLSPLLSNDATIPAVDEAPSMSSIRSRHSWLNRQPPESLLTSLREEWATTSEAVDSMSKLYPSKNVGIAFLSFRHTGAVDRCLDDPRVTGMWLDWSVAPAPKASDIIWHNISIPSWERSTRRGVAIFLLLAASVLLTSSAVLTNALIPLSEVMENAVAEADFLRLSVTGWGAPLLLFFINSLILPLLVWVAANSVKFWQQSRLDMFVLDANVVFLTLNTVIFPTVGNGSIGAFIARFYSMEVQEWNVSLGVLIASQSGSFALRYLLNACLITPGVQLLQIGSMTWWGIMNSVGKTAEPFEFDFAYSYASCIAICFMVMAVGVALPIVIPLGCCFYTVKHAVDKYNLSCGVLRARRDSGGAVAAIAVRYMVGSVGFMQFLMSGYFIAHGLSLVQLVGVFSGSANKELLRGRELILGGTCLLLVSALTAVLLTGHSLFVPRVARRQHQRLPMERESAVKSAYVHPCEAILDTNNFN